AEKKCRTEPQTSEEGCKLACGSDQRVALEECNAKADLQSCRSAARVRTLKCKQKCTADAAPALQECTGDFDGCLATCDKGASKSRGGGGWRHGGRLCGLRRRPPRRGRHRSRRRRRLDREARPFRLDRARRAVERGDREAPGRAGPPRARGRGRGAGP